MTFWADHHRRSFDNWFLSLFIAISVGVECVEIQILLLLVFSVNMEEKKKKMFHIIIEL